MIERYHELSDLVDSMASRAAADPGLTAQVAPWLLHEARLLDADRFESWLAGFTDDAVLWVPVDPTSGPGADQSLYLDDRRRLGERVAWRRDPSAWGQQPPSRCTRMIGSVEAWAEPAGSEPTGSEPTGAEPTGAGPARVVVRSSFTLDERRHHRHQLVVGHQLHELVGEPYRCRTKILLVPALATGLRNPSFLL